MDEDAGIFLTISDCTALFPRLKEHEASLSKEERMILLRMEKLVYGNLSIGEIEKLLEEAAAPLEPPAARRNK